MAPQNHNEEPRSTSRILSCHYSVYEVERTRHLSCQILVVQPSPDFLRILPQIKDRCHQNASRVRFVKNPVRKPLHHLSPDLLEIERGDLGGKSNPGKIRINGGHELHAESLAILFVAIENPLQFGVSPRKELHRQDHRDLRIRSFTCSQ